MNNERITSIEERFMHLERLVDELSGVVATQSRTLDALVQELRQLRATRLSAVTETEKRSPADDKPPHY
jgi:uncharacterized coiled-coil protein SlyX